MILPLRAIFFQILLTLVAIAIESLLLHKRLKLSRKTSLEYAISLNLLTLVAGWYLFFVFFDTLPSGMQSSLIEFILFNKYSNETTIFLFVAGILTFFITLAIKLKGWQVLEYLRNEVIFEDPQEANDQFIKSTNFFNPASVRVMAILQGHAYSHVAILGLVLVELLLHNQSNG